MIRACTTDKLLAELNARKGLKYRDVGYSYFADIKGNGDRYSHRSVYTIISEGGGVVYSSLNDRLSRKRCDKIRAAIAELPEPAAPIMQEYAVSVGNGNDGVSHLYPNYIVKAPADSEYLIARLACLSSFDSGWARKWAKRELHETEAYPAGVQACIYDPPGRDGAGWSEHNGAWRLWDVYPAAEVSEGSTAPRYDSLADCFGAAMVRAHSKES